jgi:hypothetical protein
MVVPAISLQGSVKMYSDKPHSSTPTHHIQAHNRPPFPVTAASVVQSSMFCATTAAA